MSNSLNQDEINAILWKACDTFRGTIDPSEYKNYILVMLFLKYVSDVWFDHRERYERELNDPQRVERAHEPRAIRAAQRRGLLHALRPAQRRQHRRRDRHGAGGDRRSQQGKARGRLPQHRLQQRGGARQDGAAQRAPQEPAQRLQRSAPRPAPLARRQCWT